MRFKDLKGRLRFLNIEGHRIDWDAKSLSKFQYGIKQFFKPYWLYDIMYEEMPLVGTRLRLDLYNANRRIGVECNGGQHMDFNRFFHDNNRINYLAQIRRDSKKYDWCVMNKITLIEIFPNDLPLTKSFFKGLNISL